LKAAWDNATAGTLKLGEVTERRHDMTALLDIKNLHVSVGEREILKGVDLTIRPGEIHAIMGPNGTGKSTLSYVLAGREGYDVTEGSVTFMGKDLLAMEPDERACLGIFLAFQYPVEIPGVAGTTFLKTALNAVRRYRGDGELDAMQFLKYVRAKAKELGVGDEMLRRPLNVGFSGGEKKRNEALQMAVLEPVLAILDETDSGLDIDALKVVASGVNALRSADRSLLIITHYQRLLDYIVPDHVHVMVGGRIVASGDKELAMELEEKGYAQYTDAAAA
jgi:Fe-S cluster assembly ATP-binding protein